MIAGDPTWPDPYFDDLRFKVPPRYWESMREVKMKYWKRLRDFLSYCPREADSVVCSTSLCASAKEADPG